MCIRDRVTVGSSTCGATATAQAILTNPAQLTITASAVGTNPTCFGASNGSINLTVGTSGGTPTYAWTKVGGGFTSGVEDPSGLSAGTYNVCLLYTSDAADERSSVDLGG